VGDRTAAPGKGYPVHVLKTSSRCAVTLAPEPLYAPEAPVALVPVP